MISELCPDGVSFVKIGDVLGDKIFMVVPPAKFKKEKYQKSGKYPIIDQGQSDICGYTDEECAVKAGEYVIFGEHTEIIKYHNGGFVQGADGLKIMNTGEYLIAKYLYHALKNFYKSRSKYERHWKYIIQTFIPIPPIEVQHEVVRMLDKFDALVNDIVTGLPAEIVARKKQYEYYRNQLIGFSNTEENIKWMKLDEVLNYEQPTKYIVKNTEYDKRFLTPVLTAGKTFVLGYTCEQENIYKGSDRPVIIFDDFTTAFHWVNFDFKVKSSAMKLLCAKDESKALAKFIYYSMLVINYETSNHERHWISKYSQISIPIPPIEVQKRIVKILDKFDALVNDMVREFPAEIEARRKQYEYYRNKILSFCEKTVQGGIK